MRTAKSLPLSILMHKILGHKGVVNLVTRVSVTLKQLNGHGNWSGKRGLRKRTLAPCKTKILVWKHLKNKQNRTYFLLECCHLYLLVSRPTGRLPMHMHKLPKGSMFCLRQNLVSFIFLTDFCKEKKYINFYKESNTFR